MKFFKIAALVGALALSGCSGLKEFWDTGMSVANAISSSEVNQDAFVVAATTYDSMVIVATRYQSLRRCTGSNGPLCRNPALRQQIDAAVYSGRVARNNLKEFFRTHPGQLGPGGLYDSLVTATNTIKGATAAYRTAAGR